MRPTPRLVLILLALLALGGCALTRTADLTCPAFPGALATTMSSQGVSGTPPPDPAADAEADIEAAIRAQVARAPGRRVTFQVVTLSAGGQYGAFGAGFLTGWTANPVTPRPVFDLVTGVSAGATLAPVAFAGPAFDPLLRYWRGLGQDGVVDIRPVPLWLVSPSLGSPVPLADYLDRALDASLVDAIGDGHDAGRRLLVATTDLDSGRGEVLDLGRAALSANAKPCLREAILASSAIPALFAPRRINGSLHADGGLRTQVFLRAVDEARRRVERETRADIRVEAYLIVNGAVRPPPGPVGDRLTDYVLRSVDILTDQILRDSIETAVRFAQTRSDWRLRGIRATLPETTCGGGAGQELGGFDPCLTRALFDHGVAQGRRAPIDWLDADELRAIAAAY